MSVSRKEALQLANGLLQLFKAYDSHPGDGDEAFWEVFGEIEPGELHYMAKKLTEHLEAQQ